MVLNLLAGAAAEFVVSEAVKEHVVPLVLEIVTERGGGILGRLKQGTSDRVQQAVFNASQRYVKSYANRHGILKVLGMKEPVKLDEVYTNVRLLSESSRRMFETTEALEDAFRESGKRRLQPEECETRMGVEVANEKQFLMVLGQPGAGKSTFLRKMGLEALKGKKGGLKKHRCIPVFLELKHFNSEDINILKLITEEFRICNFPKPERFTEKALEKGKLLVLFDGLDEVPGSYVNDVITKIQDFVDRYSQNRFIASCRTAAYRSGFRRFADVLMADFDDAQIEQYIQNWFSSEVDQQAETAKHCWELLQQNDQQGAKELAHTPLLLTFLCLVYDRSQRFASNRSKLYGRALRILLEEWAAEKRLNRGSIYEGLHTELEELLLAEIAYRNYVEDRLFFEKSELVGQIRDFLAGTLDAPKTLNGEAVLEAIAVQQGIFVERVDNVYSFSHLTLQEHLTAKFIVGDGRMDTVIEEHLLDRNWREVFLLVVSSIEGRGADPFLLKMIDEIEKLLEQPIYQEKLIPILEWAETETKDAGGELSNLARRSVANAIANANANAIANAIANANANANAIAYAYANAIAYAYAYAIANANAYAYANAYAKRVKLRINLLINSYQDIASEEPVFTNLNIPDLTQKLEWLKEKIPSEDSDRETKKAFANQLFQSILQAHQLPEKLVQLSKQEAKIIDNYYYATHLLIQCKDAAVRVSPETWAGIEERMLRVPERLRGSDE